MIRKRVNVNPKILCLHQGNKILQKNKGIILPMKKNYLSQRNINQKNINQKNYDVVTIPEFDWSILKILAFQLNVKIFSIFAFMLLMSQIL